jgi:hypothetical protein
MVGCKPVAYFNTPNDLFEKEGTIYLLDGSTKKGKITISFETGHDADKFIHLKNNNIDEKIAIDLIKSYEVNSELYFPKIVAFDMDGNERLLFLRRLTKEGSRIHLYELYQQARQTSDGTPVFLYYISLQSHTRLETWFLGSKHLVPDFNEKMSRLVEDCTVLANKIRQKDKGYFLAQLTISNEKKAEVMKRIIDEYNDCH